jgi:hypothetical protein
MYNCDYSFKSFPLQVWEVFDNLYKQPYLSYIMPKGRKKEGNVVKIQVEAKNPPRKKAPRQRGRIGGGVPKQLIETTIGLQKVISELALKMDNLTGQIAALLGLFESAAKSFSEIPSIHTAERDKEFMDKINQLLEQDKVIAKGILYIEDKVNQMSPEASAASSVAAAPAMPPTPIIREGFQPSITPQQPQAGKPLPKA